MTKSKELRQELGELVTRQRAILDAARDAKRSLSAAEENEIKKHDARLDELEKEIPRMEQLERRENWAAQPASEVVLRPSVRSDGGYDAPARATRNHAPMFWTDQETGKELRSYSMSRGENLAEAFGVSDMPEKLSLGKMISGYVRGEWPRGWEAEQRAVQKGIQAQGGFVVPEAMGNVIPLAANNAVVLQAGAEVMDMPAGTLKLGRQIADPAANWYGELPTELSLTDPTFGLFELQAKTLAVRVLCSVQWIEDALNGPQLIEEAVGRSLGLAFDSAILNGVTNPFMEGLRQWLPNDAPNSLNEISKGTNGGQITSYADFINAVKLVLEGNYAGDLTDLTAVMAPRTWATVQLLTEATTNAVLQPPPVYAGLKKLVSTQLPITEQQGSSNAASTVYVGDFRKVLVGLRKGITIEATRTGGDAWKRLGVEIRGYVRLDWTVMQPKHLARVIGVIP